MREKKLIVDSGLIDKLAEERAEVASHPTTPQRIMGEAIQHLQGRQKEVYMLVVRDDRSWADAGKVLGISKGSVQIYLNRAVRFITAYCKQAMDKGRV